MRFLIQNVDEARIECFDENWKVINKDWIWKWIIIYFGVWKDDEKDFMSKIEKFINKLKKLRFLKSKDCRLDATLNDVNWKILIVSNFTLYWTCKKWSKIDFWNSAKFDIAKQIYDQFLALMEKEWFDFITGEFWSMMEISSKNNWPVNYIFDY